jgi:6-phosphofructokinase 1
MRIGILTGGGDVPGLNPCIKTVVKRADELGWEVVGFRRGWMGPLHYNPDDPGSAARTLVPLTPDYVRNIDQQGGTVLHTSRLDPGLLLPADLPEFLAGAYPLASGAALHDVTPHILRVIEHVGLDALIAIGGDGTLSYAARLEREGVPIMGIPKTMDNDVFGTDYCIGFSTAVSRSVEYVNQLRTTAGSHERIAIVEVFGRNSGETALISSYLADVDRALIAEVPFDVERVAGMLARDRRDNPARYAMAVISEGAYTEGGALVARGEADPHGNRKLGGVGEILGQDIRRLTGVNVICQNLAYLIRSGLPDSLDRMVATSYGTMAVQLLAEGRSGRMMALNDGKYDAVPIRTCGQGKKRVDVPGLYDTEEYRPRIARVLHMPMFLY